MRIGRPAKTSSSNGLKGIYTWKFAEDLDLKACWWRIYKTIFNIHKLMTGIFIKYLLEKSSVSSSDQATSDIYQYLFFTWELELSVLFMLHNLENDIPLFNMFAC